MESIAVYSVREKEKNPMIEGYGGKLSNDFFTCIKFQGTHISMNHGKPKKYNVKT